MWEVGLRMMTLAGVADGDGDPGLVPFNHSGSKCFQMVTGTDSAKRVRCGQCTPALGLSYNTQSRGQWLAT